MTDIRHQVFVSSTYEDLREERSAVMEALLHLDCIPSGMELFPAADNDQWKLITDVIDECDYYLVVVAGKYGSDGPAGVGYTEMEYRYALDQGKPIVGFVVRDPQKLPGERLEIDPDRRTKLEEFRSLVKSKPCAFWQDATELSLVVTQSLVKLRNSNPSPGWVRADSAGTADDAKEILRLTRENSHLRIQLDELSTGIVPGTEGLAQGEECHTVPFQVEFYWKSPDNEQNFKRREIVRRTVEVSWDEMFVAMFGSIHTFAANANLKESLKLHLEDCRGVSEAVPPDYEDADVKRLDISSSEIEKIAQQFRALKLVRPAEKRTQRIDRFALGATAEAVGSRIEEGWELTAPGEQRLADLTAIKRDAIASTKGDSQPID